MGRHRAQDRPPGGVDRPGIAWWDDREDPAASLSAALRGWTTPVEGGPRGPRLVLHRSVVSRVAALVVLVPVAVLLSLTGLGVLVDPSDREARVLFALFAVPGTPVVLWVINMFRRRTVLSERGIEMRRLVRTARRSWPAARSGLAVSARIISGQHGNEVERYRLALVDGMPGDLIRLPGCVFDGSLRWHSERARDKANMALRAVWSFAARRGWIVSDPAAYSEDPRLVEARAHAAGAGGAGAAGRPTGMMGRLGMSRPDGAAGAGRPLVYRAPAWGRMWEYLCDAGLFLLCLGAAFTLFATLVLLDPGHTDKDFFYSVLLLVLALAALGYCAVKLAPFVRRTVVDREGIHVGRATHPWPGSRSGLYVAGDRAVLVHPDGYAIPLPGTGGARGGFVRREMRATAQCEEIWRWGVANGVARDGGAYVPLRWVDGQREREIHERRAGTGPDAGSPPSD